MDARDSFDRPYTLSYFFNFAQLFAQFWKVRSSGNFVPLALLKIVRQQDG
jgi:hypothetical protein